MEYLKYILQLQVSIINLAGYMDALNKLLVEKGVLMEDEIETAQKELLEKPEMKQMLDDMNEQISEIQKAEQNPMKYLFDSFQTRKGRKSDNGKEE